MQTQITKEMHWMRDFGLIVPEFLKNIETKPEENKSRVGIQKNKMFCDDDKNIMMIEIKKQLQLGLKRSIDIYFALEEIDALPKFGEQNMSEIVFRKYVTLASKELFPNKKLVAQDIVSLFKKRKSIDEITKTLKTDKRYVRLVLAKQGLIEKRKTSRIYTKKAA